MSTATELRRVVVVGRRDVADDVVELVLAPAADSGVLPAFEAGAHVDVRVGDDSLRQYSLLPPREADRYRIAVLRETAGRGGSAYLCDTIAAGDALHIGEPRNTFPLRDDAGVLLVAGGIGITPLAGMAEALEARGVEWGLRYLGRSRSSMAYVDELESAHPGRVEVHTAEAGTRADLAAIVAELAAGTAVYACGPERMLSALHETVAAREDLRLHLERFAAPEEPAGAHVDAPFELELRRSDQLLEVPVGTTALDVLEDAGHFILSSCREGTCGSCEVAVLDGEVDHRDWVLDDEERQRNDRMFVCVSRARTPRLTLDL